MVGYISLEEQVDKDFRVARRRASLERIGARLRRRDAASDGLLLCFDEVRKIPGASARVYRGPRTVPVGQIGGSVGRCSEFDGDFMPAKASVEERWKHVDRAFHRGAELPPVSLYKLGGFYFVLDGHHRVSVAHYHGVEWIDAYVTEFGAAGLWSDPRDKDGPIDPSKKGEEPKLHEMMDSQIWKQRREEVMREVKLNHLAKRVRATRKWRAGRRSALVWEMKRQAGRLLKLLRILRNAGG